MVCIFHLFAWIQKVQNTHSNFYFDIAVSDLVDAVDSGGSANHAVNNANATEAMDLGAPSTSAPTIKWGSEGRSLAFNPFKRSKNIPFSIYGRRRSISVFPDIRESVEGDDVAINTTE